MGLLVSFLYLCLHIAVIVFVAYCFVWLLRFLGIGIDPMVYKIGQIIVGLIILIAVVVWLSSVVGGGTYHFPWWR